MRWKEDWGIQLLAQFPLLPRFGGVTNREAVIFDGANPEVE
jgi:hypothetical protein